MVSSRFTIHALLAAAAMPMPAIAIVHTLKTPTSECRGHLREAAKHRIHVFQAEKYELKVQKHRQTPQVKLATAENSAMVSCGISTPKNPACPVCGISSPGNSACPSCGISFPEKREYSQLELIQAELMEMVDQPLTCWDRSQTDNRGRHLQMSWDTQISILRQQLQQALKACRSALDKAARHHVKPFMKLTETLREQPHWSSLPKSDSDVEKEACWLCGISKLPPAYQKQALLEAEIQEMHMSGKATREHFLNVLLGIEMSQNSVLKPAHVQELTFLNLATLTWLATES